MSRTVAASIITAMAQGTFVPLLLVEFEFDSGDLNIWNGIGELTVSSTTYTGAGDLLSISQAEETSQVISRGMDIILSGIPSSLVALAIAEPFQGRSCVVKIGFEGSEDTAVLFSGLLDQMNIDESSSTSVITVNVENELAALDRIVPRLYSDHSHQSRFPGDKAFEFVTAVDKVVNWGGPA